jgi:phosphoribosylanthranilate isomerase
VQNAKQAIEILNPDVMDFNSGVETEPGRKNHRKLTDLFRELRG